MLVGSLWFWPLLGVDPVPNRLAHPFRLLAIFATLPFHAILGLTVMQDNDLIAASYYNGLNRTWGSSPLTDQHAAAGSCGGPGTWSASSCSSPWASSGPSTPSARPSAKIGGLTVWKRKRHAE